MIIPKTKQCIIDLKSRWLTIWFNRPEKRNSLSEILIKEILKTLDFAEQNSLIRGVIFRGKGNVFCAGADLKWMQSIASEKNDAQNKSIH